MLDHLECESLEARRTKNQLTMFFKIIHGLVDIPACDYLVPASTRTRSQHSLKFLQIPVSSEYYKFSFYLVPSVVGTLYQPMWLKLPVWYPLNGSSQVCQFKLSGPAMQVYSHDILKHVLSGTSGALVPSRQAAWLSIEKWKMHWPKLLIFFWLSINYTSIFPIIHSLFLMQQTPAL